MLARLSMTNHWEGHRPEPESCREQDIGRFEILHTDGRARLGRIHTEHGLLHTPALLPVVNPNIRTIEPREMWDRWNIEGLITNSYIIWKHDELNQKAKQDGVHQLINYPGVVVCDSGTFQSYIYGDVEVEVEEIIRFQKDIGVDIATMLDVFTRPDMSREEVKNGVELTAERAQPSLQAAEGMMVNGPIQGGLEWDLRELSATSMSEHGFAIHPIGGIVPIMEKQRYLELLKVMLSTIPHLPQNRPVHLFGCGHPMLFPMTIALGADLFDSAAYALFARDNRLLTPWGTVKLEGLEHWPLTTPSLFGTTPEQVRAMDVDSRCKILAEHNLDVSIAELDRCRQAVRDGTIWELAEARSHQHPALREAFLWLINTLPNRGEKSTDDNRWHNAWNWILEANVAQRGGGVRFISQESNCRPWVAVARKLLHERWKQTGEKKNVLILHGRSGPWREKVGTLVRRIRAQTREIEILVHTPIGLLPWALEDLNPFAHIQGSSMLYREVPELEWCKTELSRMNLKPEKIMLLDMKNKSDLMDSIILEFPELELHNDHIQDEEEIRMIEIEQCIARLALFANLDPDIAVQELVDCSFIHSRTRRVKNILLNDGMHIASPRMRDGGLSMTAAGAKWLHSFRKEPLPEGFENRKLEVNTHKGPPWVVIDSDAIPFVKDGRNVFHGFIKAVDSWLRLGTYCHVVDENGELIGHGTCMTTIVGMKDHNKGVAIKIRDGIK
mgnify:CR=1 FL=1